MTSTKSLLRKYLCNISISLNTLCESQLYLWVSLSEITMKFWTRFLTLQALTAITYHGPCQILCFRDGRCFVIKEKFLSASAQDILRQNDIPFVIQKTLRCDSNKSLPFMHTWYHFSFFAYLNKFSPVTFSTL